MCCVISSPVRPDSCELKTRMTWRAFNVVHYFFRVDAGLDRGLVMVDEQLR